MTPGHPEPVPPGSIWQYTIYESPADHPGSYVVRGWIIVPGEPNPRPTNFFRLYPSLEDARFELDNGELVPIPRDPRDDPKIVETWI